MTKILLFLGIAAALLGQGAYGFDWPTGIEFQLGFNIRVVPGPQDRSGDLCLGVFPEKINSDKVHTLVVTGIIKNYSDIPCEGVDMHFAVTSYIGTGFSRNRAVVVPSTIPPGGTATFNAHISLDSPKPKDAMYTITAYSPALCGPIILGNPGHTEPLVFDEPLVPEAGEEIVTVP